MYFHIFPFHEILLIFINSLMFLVGYLKKIRSKFWQVRSGLGKNMEKNGQTRHHRGTHFFNTWSQDRPKPIYGGPWATLRFWASRWAQILSPLRETQRWGRTNSEGLLAIPHSIFLPKNCQKLNFQGLLAISLCQGSDWSNAQNANIEGLLAMSPCQGSDWNSDQKSNFEGLLAMPPCQGSDWTGIQNSNFEDLQAMSHCPVSDWNFLQK